MDTLSQLSQLREAASREEALRAELLEAGESERPLRAFCRAARRHGFDLYEMDLIDAGADHYAQMKRSQNGGGENSPVLEHSADYFESFLEELRGEADGR